ncbi:MAG TPA: hypothetical protein VL371_22845 [Gemmataceae bacterium]|jgi:hypothetical protein|nr:hypothetical protein [Gemmataceae bacterium]
MRRLRMVLCTLLFVAGCVSPDGRGYFDEAIKDWNGDNQRMRSDAKWDDLPGGMLPRARQ